MAIYGQLETLPGHMETLLGHGDPTNCSALVGYMGQFLQDEANGCFMSLLIFFLALQNSSIGDLVPCLVPWSDPTNNQSLHNTTE